jgi:hypothetical protein
MRPAKLSEECLSKSGEADPNNKNLPGLARPKECHHGKFSQGLFEFLL